MKAIDIVKPPAKTALEDYRRWQNNIQSQFRTMPHIKRQKVEVTYYE